MKSAAELEQIVLQMGIGLNGETCWKLQNYLLLLEKWNSKINLTASNDWQGIGPLLQEGIWASRFYPEEATAHLDIGSGAGFPAMPMRIVLPRIQLDMVESRAKRAVFLETAVRELGLAGAHVHHGRLEQQLRGSRKVWDCVSWKAIKLSSADIEDLLRHSHKKTQFWMFHGRELAIKEPEAVKRSFRLLRSERFPLRRDWFLSMFIQK
jgi:16S rRNA (guanine(527)-N(7))-methyltransferase RsmG